MPSFHEVIFPEDISYGSSGGPAFNTTVIELTSGHEQRNINWQETKASYEVSHGVKTRAQMEDLLDFFNARHGKAYGFRFKDWADFEAIEQPIAIGDGVETDFQMVKIYEPSGYPFTRKIRKIAPGTLHVFKNAVETLLFTADINSGFISFDTAPALGVIVTATCEFHVPVRFDTDEMKIAHDAWETMSWPSIPLVEIKPRLSNGVIIE